MIRRLLLATSGAALILGGPTAAVLAASPAHPAAHATPRPIAVPAAAAQQLSTDALKEEAAEEAAALEKLSQEIVDMVFSFSELGFQEHWTADYITGLLADQGFRIERGCAHMPTCYVARWGTGSPVIMIMGDIDGLPETSQKPGVAYRDPLIPGGPGHGEGHNSAPAVDVVTAIATKRVMERHGIEGEIRVVPGVAEELVASRTYMVNAGLFDDVDAALSTHVSSEFSTSHGIGGYALVSTMYSFEGQTAHGAGSPWEGRSALDAAVLMDIGWNFRREHLHPRQRSHSVIPQGGNQPNVVPGEASAWYFFREYDYPSVRELHEIGTTIAEAAAMMTGTMVDERVIGAAWPVNYNKPMAEALWSNIRAVGMPEWSEADQTLARAVQAELGRDSTPGLRTELPDSLDELSGGGGGSDDIAEVAWNVPTVRLGYPSNIPGVTYHHWSAAIAMATPIAHRGANHGARALAMTAIELLTDPELLQAAKRHFREVQTAEYEWASLIPEDETAPAFLNEEKMERFRPMLDTLRYDPTRFETYLEQLGIEYPTVRTETAGTDEARGRR